MFILFWHTDPFSECDVTQYIKSFPHAKSFFDLRLPSKSITTSNSLFENSHLNINHYNTGYLIKYIETISNKKLRKSTLSKVSLIQLLNIGKWGFAK